jgi:hypothetical protein
MRTTGTKRAARNALYRLGLHARPREVVQSLAQHGVQVGEELVRLVRIELVKENTGARVAEVPGPVPSPRVRRRPQGCPGRHHR